MNLILTYLAKHWEQLELEKYGSPAKLSCVIATPRFRASKHVIFFILAEGHNGPLLVAKTPRLADNHESLDREARNLGLVQSAQPHGFTSIPKVVAYEDYRGVKILFETALSGEPFRPALVRKNPEFALQLGMSWLIEVHQATAQPRPAGQNWFDENVVAPLEILRQRFSLSFEERELVDLTIQQCEPLGNLKFPSVCEHGDFSHPNILLSGKKSAAVVDWELAEYAGLPLVDLFFFCTYVAFAERRATKTKDHLAAFQNAFFTPDTRFWQCVSEYCGRLKLSKEAVAPLFVLCWTRYVTGLLTRIQGEGCGTDSVGNQTISWLRSNRYYHLWRHSVERFDQLGWQKTLRSR